MCLLTNPMSFETTAVTFITTLHIFLVIILLLLAIFLYKCFVNNNDEETEKVSCKDGDGNEDCSATTVELNDSGDPEKTILMQTMDEDTPERHGILVQRQRKVVIGIPLDNKEDLDKETEEAKTIKKQEPENAGESGPQGESLTKIGIPMDIENQKRPLKGVTFSREVVVMDLGKEDPTPESCTREHKERK